MRLFNQFKPISLCLLGAFIFVSCNKNTNIPDATGTFEATETIVSSEVIGKIVDLKIEEGTEVKQGQLVVSIDKISSELQKEQVNASINALKGKLTNAEHQVLVYEENYKALEAQIATMNMQMDVLKKEQVRIKNLFKDEAATAQQVDDINGKVDVLVKQIEATQKQKAVIKAQINAARATADLQNKAILSERQPLEKKVLQIDDQMKRGDVVNPVSGTVLTKYCELGELVTIGKPLYKVANLSEMTLRAYITGDQLPKYKIGQNITVLVDNDKDKQKPYQGTVTWISDKAEFTPKTIQTKNERSNLVYAMKVKVKNDGFIKIGMYGEIEHAKQ
ncbi:MAG: HlyD family efflux transporter periplasmic adaptor subunit [Saprospiraceae bacterium]|nr:HlyD family efflux transporter periplasmic adaptor subunit [Saprospiraceae bacterium]